MGGTIVTVAVTENPAPVAVTFTVPPLGIADGAVYVTAPTSSLAPNEPHAFPLPQVAVQLIGVLKIDPSGPFASVIDASTVTVAFTAICVGGACMKMIPVGVG